MHHNSFPPSNPSPRSPPSRCTFFPRSHPSSPRPLPSFPTLVHCPISPLCMMPVHPVLSSHQLVKERNIEHRGFFPPFLILLHLHLLHLAQHPFPLFLPVPPPLFSVTFIFDDSPPVILSLDGLMELDEQWRR